MPIASHVLSPRLLSLGLLIGTAHAATLTLVGYDLQPHRQRVLISAEVSLGYPLGDAAVGLVLECRTGEVTLVNLGYSMLGSVSPFTDYGAKVASPALNKALLASGLVTIKPGVLTVKRVSASASSTLSSRCDQGVLDAALVAQSSDDHTRTIKVPIYSGEVERNGFSTDPLRYDADTLTIEGDVVIGPKRFMFRDLTVGGTLVGSSALPTLQVLLSDGKSVYPIFYGGQSQTNAALDKLAVPAALTVYTTYDGTGWTKTVIDLKANRVRTTPASKPKLPVRS